MGFSFVGGKSQKCSANWSKSTTDGGQMHNKAFFWLLNLSIKVRLFDHNFFSFVFNLFANVKKVIMVLGHQAFDGSKRILGRS